LFVGTLKGPAVAATHVMNTVNSLLMFGIGQPGPCWLIARVKKERALKAGPSFAGAPVAK